MIENKKKIRNQFKFKQRKQNNKLQRHNQRISHSFRDGLSVIKQQSNLSSLQSTNLIEFNSFKANLAKYLSQHAEVTISSNETPATLSTSQPRLYYKHNSFQNNMQAHRRSLQNPRQSKITGAKNMKQYFSHLAYKQEKEKRQQSAFFMTQYGENIEESASTLIFRGLKNKQTKQEFITLKSSIEDIQEKVPIHHTQFYFFKKRNRVHNEQNQRIKNLRYEQMAKTKSYNLSRYSKRQQIFDSFQVGAQRMKPYPRNPESPKRIPRQRSSITQNYSKQGKNSNRTEERQEIAPWRNRVHINQFQAII